MKTKVRQAKELLSGACCRNCTHFTKAKKSILSDDNGGTCYLKHKNMFDFYIQQELGGSEYEDEYCKKWKKA